MAMSRNLWGSDVPISAPVPVDISDSVSVPFGGLAMTPMGLAFDLTFPGYEETFLSRYAPEDDRG